MCRAWSTAGSHGALRLRQALSPMQLPPPLPHKARCAAAWRPLTSAKPGAHLSTRNRRDDWHATNSTSSSSSPPPLPPPPPLRPPPPLLRAALSAVSPAPPPPPLLPPPGPSSVLRPPLLLPPPALPPLPAPMLDEGSRPQETPVIAGCCLWPCCARPGAAPCSGGSLKVALTAWKLLLRHRSATRRRQDSTTAAVAPLGDRSRSRPFIEGRFGGRGGCRVGADCRRSRRAQARERRVGASRPPPPVIAQSAQGAWRAHPL
jgi:hypothetical protein